MNNVTLIGRLTKDPEIKYSGDTQIANFSIAIDRPPRKDGTKDTDFPRCVAFNKTAEILEKYARKGARLGVTGRIQTGSYENQNGDRVYTTDIVADRIDIIDWPEQEQQPQRFAEPTEPYTGGYNNPFQQMPQQPQPGTYDNPFAGDPNYNYGRR